MSKQVFPLDSLVLYKNRPARVVHVAEKKIAIEIEEGSTISVRFKDVVLLHPGPLRNLSDLQPMDGEVTIAWELLAGESTNLAELAELIYGRYKPTTAWAAWLLVADGLYFSGNPGDIQVRVPAEVTSENRARQEKKAEERRWRDFLARVESGIYIEEDKDYLEDVSDLALGKRGTSRVMKALGLTDAPEDAHALLLNLGYWDYSVNPYPSRSHMPPDSAEVPLGDLVEGERRDLTHLVSLAIDDEGSHDPDDALSIEDGRLWVHIADVAALVSIDSPADLEARSRGANLYLPERTVTMLPKQATQALAMGLVEVSPALSFGLDISEEGEVTNLEIAPSWVRVTRLTYDEADTRIDETFLHDLERRTNLHRDRRMRNGAIEIDLPEVKIHVHHGGVEIRPLPPLRSREIVREAMLMTGEAVAGYAIENEIPMPFTTQDRSESEQPEATTLSQMFAVRKTLRPGSQTSRPGMHAGLGLDGYVQATSPLRRYLDLVVHQQLCSFLSGTKTLDDSALMERIAAAGEIIRSVRRIERRSNEHWKLVYLLQHPDWRGDGVVVEKKGARSTCTIPELALETDLYLRKEPVLDSVIRLAVADVNLAHLDAHFTLAS